MKTKFTLIIPTYNRYPFLCRLLHFYQSYGFPFPIMVVDSSCDPLELEELKSLLSCDEIIYEKVDQDAMLEAKVLHCLKKVATPYVAVCGDDDFLMPTGISDCIQFLAKNSDYTCVQGLAVQHYIFQGPSGGDFSWQPLYWQVSSNEGDNPQERFRGYLAGGKSGGQYFHAVYRRDTLQCIFEEATKYVPGYYWHELFTGSISLISGKGKILPVFYSSREPHQSGVFDEEYRKKCFSRSKVDLAIERLATHLQESEGLERESAESIVRNSLNSHIERSFLKNGAQRGSLFLSKVVAKIARLKIGILHKIHKLSYSRLLEDKNSRFYSDYLKLKEAVLSAGLSGEEAQRARDAYPL